MIVWKRRERAVHFLPAYEEEAEKVMPFDM